MKKITIKQLQKLLWDECKRIVHSKYPPVCYTCGASNLVGSNRQTGHLIAKAFLKPYLKYDLRLLRPQCMRCNLRLGGLGAIFYTRMRKEEGDEYVDEILFDTQCQMDKKDVYGFYQCLIEDYKKL